MTSSLVKVGTWVAFNVESELCKNQRVEGEVLTSWGDPKNPGRHRLSVRATDDRIFLLWASELENGLALTGRSVDLREAEHISRSHLQGERVNIPVEEQLNILAAAVLQLKGAA